MDEENELWIYDFINEINPPFAILQEGDKHNLHCITLN